MEIGKPIEELPNELTITKGKYKEIWAAAIRADGNWVPVICKTSDEARRLSSAAGWRKRAGHPALQTRIFGTTLYIRLRPSTNGTEAV